MTFPMTGKQKLEFIHDQICELRAGTENLHRLPILRGREYAG